MRRMAVPAIDADVDWAVPLPTCWCCGDHSDVTHGFVRLLWHSEVLICYRCLDLLNRVRARQLNAFRGWLRRSRWDLARRRPPPRRSSHVTAKRPLSPALKERQGQLRLTDADGPGVTTFGTSR